MGFEDQIKAFTEKAKKDIEAKMAEVKNNANKALQDLLGEDASKIESISLNTNTGKFYSVVAPESVIDKLRCANLLKKGDRFIFR